MPGHGQLAVAFHHHPKETMWVPRSVLERALRNLNGADSSFPISILIGCAAELENSGDANLLIPNARMRERTREESKGRGTFRRHDVLNSSGLARYTALPIFHLWPSRGAAVKDVMATTSRASDFFSYFLLIRAFE